MKPYILALDQGTTSSRAILFDRRQQVVGCAQKEFTQIYPQAGWVEHDAEEIYGSQWEVLGRVLRETGISAAEVAAIGITNQRETTIVWDKATGRPIHNAIVWQCRRTAPQCEKMKEDGCEGYVRDNTGLLIDAYFSATKVKWLLDNIPGARDRAKRGELLFGTVDTWLIWRLTGGKVHATDYTNASRTMLFNIHTLAWDDEILRLLGIPRCMLPEVKSSGELYGIASINGVEVPIAGVAGDQQSALFGQACFDRGEAKNTYGTGCFLLMNTGNAPCFSDSGMLTTLAATVKGEPVQYAIEGSVFTGGAVVQWLRDGLHLIEESRDTDYYAGKVPDSGGVYVVPAFTGLGAPYWDMFARGTIIGITRGTNRAHIIRASLESIAYQSKELLDAIEADTGLTFEQLKADGGASANDFLMQFQADLIGRPVVRPKLRESTALGAAYLAGLTVGFFSSKSELRSLNKTDRVYLPQMAGAERERRMKGWRKAVSRARAWAEEEEQ